jgi:hypothetical protein
MSTERKIKPEKQPPGPGLRPKLMNRTLAAIDTTVEAMVPEIVQAVTAELTARLEHVGLHTTSSSEEIVVRTLPYSPFFEVTTRTAS